MRIAFTGKDRGQILASIKAAFAGRKLGEIVDFAMDAGHLTVIISKMGTSTLLFKERETAAGLEYALETEKIALTHRAFKGEVTAKILKVIEKAGGRVTA